MLHVYTSVVPVRVRRWVRARLSPRLWNFLTHRVTSGGIGARLLDGLAVARGRLRYRRWLRAGCVLVRGERRLIAAAVHQDASPLLAQRENLQIVMAALTGAGVSHFCVRGTDNFSSVVAVPQSQRTRALAALFAAAEATPVHLAPVADGLSGSFRLPGFRALRRLSKAPVVRVVRYLTDPSGALVMGAKAGCDVEFWLEDGGRLLATRKNRAADSVPAHGPAVQVHESAFTRLVAADSADARRWPTRPEMAGDLIDDLRFPIDVVYTWVDGSDPAWQVRRDRALGAETSQLNSQSANAARFVSRDELRYSFRSVNTFAPWVRRIFLVVDDQIPRWLDVSHDRVRVVTHKELFGDRGRLPTFNSHAIESQLHRIDGLAEHFLYLNDDFFLGRPLAPTTFFQPNGLPKLFLSTSKIDPGPVDTQLDIPATAAAKNTRAVVGREFGRRVTFKTKHVPVALRRSLLTEMSARYRSELEETARHQFRHPQDVSPTSSLYQYHAFLSGRAVLDRISYMYLDLCGDRTPALLRLALARRQFDVFCLNDTESELHTVDDQRALMQAFLGAYFPVPAPWELPDA